tara:strand:- start:823 stop:1980 length:1158 start_codon:yes stop_codon:yes gene_type:complete
MNQDLAKLEAELLFCDAQILFGKAAIKKYELEKIEINKKIKELHWKGSSNPISVSNRNVVYTDDGETVLLKSWSDDEKSVEKPNKKTEEKNKMIDNNTKELKSNNIGIVNPELIKDSHMEKSGIPFKFLLEDVDILSYFPEEDDEEWSIGKWSREMFWRDIDEHKTMTVEKLSDLIGMKIDYNYGDFINFDDYRYCNMFIVGKNGQLYRNPDNSDSGGISIPLEISQYLYDSIEKYKDVANDIDVGPKDKILDNYSLTDQDKLKLKFYWVMDDGLIAEDKNGNNVELVPAKKSKDNKVTKQKVTKEVKLTVDTLKGKSIVFTGGKDKDLIKLFEENDIKVGSAVSKNTYMLIAKSLDEESTKITKAKELDIPINSLDEFKKSLGV